MADIAIGTHAVETALKATPARVKRVLIDASAQRRHAKIIDAARIAGVKVAMVTRDVLYRQCRNHNGVLAELEPFQYAALSDLLQSTKPGTRVALVLDGVTDPQNLGAVLRSAGAFGADFIIIPKDRSASVTPVVSKIAAGALEVVKIAQETNLVRAIKSLKAAGFWCYVLEAGAESILSDIDLAGDIALVLGSEGKGVRRLVKEASDMVCSIPAKGPIPSLNVASAAACALYEVFRRRTGRPT
jgi:23S rRNA (guanosine2251-2'-O)-methyltransferase